MSESTPTTMAGFTPEWLTHVLRHSGSIPTSTTATSVSHEILGQGEGFMGELARLTVGYDGEPGPATLIAKIPTQVAHNRARGRSLGVYQREVRVYADLLPDLPIPVPKVYAAIYEETGEEPAILEQMRRAEKLPLWLLRILVRRAASNADVPPTVLLLEDLGASAKVGDQVAGASIEVAAGVLETLARFHAASWGATDLPDEPYLQSPIVITRILHAGYRNSYKRFIEQMGHLLSPHTIDLLRAVKRTGIARRRRLYTEPPQCLLHVDFRLDNLFFDDEERLACVIDWQTSTPGPAVYDLCYFLTGSLAAATAESDIDDLIARYHQCLLASGVTGYPLEQLRSDYDDCLMVMLEGMPLGVDDLEFGDERGRDLIERWIERLDARVRHIPA